MELKHIKLQEEDLKLRKEEAARWYKFMMVEQATMLTKMELELELQGFSGHTSERHGERGERHGRNKVYSCARARCALTDRPSCSALQHAPTSYIIWLPYQLLW